MGRNGFIYSRDLERDIKLTTTTGLTAALVDLVMIRSSSIFSNKLLIWRWIKCKALLLKYYFSQALYAG